MSINIKTEHPRIRAVSGITLPGRKAGKGKQSKMPIIAKKRLRIVIVGAGIAGMAAALACGQAGHDVVVFEEVPEIKEAGAGIQVAPNMFRLLNRWGLGSQIKKSAVSLTSIRLRRWQSGALLGVAPITQRFGDQYVIHRADLHRIISTTALALPNVTLFTSSHVLRGDFYTPAVLLSSGQTIEADVVLGADGIKSRLREQLLLCSGVIDKPRPTGDAAFRIIIPGSRMRDDPDLEALLEEPVGTRWMGPGRHVMAYPINAHECLNVVLVHPDGVDIEESWTAEGLKDVALKQYEGWDTMLGKLLKLIPGERVKRWKLCTHESLDTWVNGSFALMGDACHPMLPYVAQGAAQAVEDAATLAIVLSNVLSRNEIPQALKTYEIARKSRAESIQYTAEKTRDALHLPDGEAQEFRDEKFRHIYHGGENPDCWGDQQVQSFLWGWDAEKVAWEYVETYMAGNR